MDRLARDALAAVNAFLERHERPQITEWTPGPPGYSPVELAAAHAGFADVTWQQGQLRFSHTYGVRTHWTPPDSVRHFVQDWDAGKYPALVADGPF